MSAIFADLVVPNVDPLIVARQLPADVVRRRLQSIDPVGLPPMLVDIWSSATLIGVDWSTQGDGPARGEVGVSLDFAALVGRGFSADTYLPEAVDDADRRLVTDPATPPLRRAAARDQIRLAERGALIRGPRLEVIREIVGMDRARDEQIRLSAAFDVHATREVDFVEGFRRRLAYALGFEASLRVGSPRPYQDPESSLIGGSLAELRREVPPAGAEAAFSVYLNLLARLRAARAAPLDVVDAADKDAALFAGLRAAAEHKRGELTPDGQVALRALLLELDVFMLRPLPYASQPPIWGRLAASSAYQDAVPT